MLKYSIVKLVLIFDEHYFISLPFFVIYKQKVPLENQWEKTSLKIRPVPAPMLKFRVGNINAGWLDTKHLMENLANFFG